MAPCPCRRLGGSFGGHENTLTIVVDLLLDTWFAAAHSCVLANILEVLRDLVHLISLKVRHDDVDIVAAAVMHSAEKHEFGELRDRSARKNSGSCGRKIAHLPC